MSLGRAAQRLQATLAVAQVALCLALLVGANLMIRSFLALQSADLGFDHRPLLTTRGYLAGDAYDDIGARAAFYRPRRRGAAATAGCRRRGGDDEHSGRRRRRDRRLVIDGRTGGGRRDWRAGDRHHAQACSTRSACR